MTVLDIQDYLGFATPQSIYHWFTGRNMPSVDNLYALSELFHMPVDAMLCGNRSVRFKFEKYPFGYRLCAYYVRLRQLQMERI